MTQHYTMLQRNLLYTGVTRGNLHINTREQTHARKIKQKVERATSNELDRRLEKYYRD
jgi:ATP-dependent exoDNAse (exonuclease V) alpha subunit